MAGRFNNKWTAEEEAAMRNGITKHGVGKWRIILNDPEFSAALRHRTNVSLKDKWRTIKGYKPVRKIIKKSSRYCTKSVANFTSDGGSKDEIAQLVAPARIYNYESSEVENLDELISSFHDCKLDDLTDAKQLSTSMLKQKQLRPPNLKRFLYGNTNSVTANEKFNEEQHEIDYDSADRAKAEVDAEVWRIRVMTPEDAAAAAAAAVEMAEVAIAEAEEAEREAVEAERLAEEKKFIAEALERKLEEMKARAATKQGKRGRRRNC